MHSDVRLSSRPTSAAGPRQPSRRRGGGKLPCRPDFAPRIRITRRGRDRFAHSTPGRRAETLISHVDLEATRGWRTFVSRSTGLPCARPAKSRFPIKIAGCQACFGDRPALTFHVADPTPDVARDARMIVFDGGYVGLAPVPGGRVNVGIVLAGARWMLARMQLKA